MNISIKKATEADLPAIQSLASGLLNYERENFDSSLKSQWAFSDEAKEKFLKAISEKFVAIADVDGKASGYLIGKILDASAGSARSIKQAYLENIFVIEEFRGNSIGEKLFAEFEAFCKREGVSRINVCVLAANEGACNFYKKTGFLPRSLNLSKDI